MHNIFGKAFFTQALFKLFTSNISPEFNTYLTVKSGYVRTFSAVKVSLYDKYIKRALGLTYYSHEIYLLLKRRASLKKKWRRERDSNPRWAIKPILP